jgi:hypothetical protein
VVALAMPDLSCTVEIHRWLKLAGPDLSGPFLSAARGGRQNPSADFWQIFIPLASGMYSSASVKPACQALLRALLTGNTFHSLVLSSGMHSILQDFLKIFLSDPVPYYRPNKPILEGIDAKICSPDAYRLDNRRAGRRVPNVLVYAGIVARFLEWTWGCIRCWRSRGVSQPATVTSDYEGWHQ